MPEIDSSQIQDGTIVNADISASAAIATSKLAEGNLFMKKTGGTFTGDVSMGGTGNQINGLVNPVFDEQAARKGYVDGGDSTLQTQITSLQTTSLQVSNFVFHEVPSGTINGTNKDFTLINTPLSGTAQVYKNGLLQVPSDDYGITGTTISFAIAPLTGSKIRVHYIK